AAFSAFMDSFKEKTGAYPIYPVFHMSQALNALKAAYEKAIDANGGAWPSHEQVVDAMAGLTFTGLGREVRIREDNQGVEDQLLGTTIHVDGRDFAVLDNMMMFDGDEVTTPVDRESVSWLETLTPDFVGKVKVESFSHGS
ncbi:MAG: branched-chain amino acid ABC transporter substrate-binding protein, partial [Kiloniellales bacterium]|nr:branched-chain amino acid ABC transporter substrate-binding protein [Kiloniellales bacterium]